MNPINFEELSKKLEDKRNREYFRYYVSNRNAARASTKKSKRGTRKMNTIPKPATPISYQELREMVNEGTLYKHHSAYFSGYVSRTLKEENMVAYPYKGHFGTGYILDTPNWESTRFSRRTYYIFTE